MRKALLIPVILLLALITGCSGDVTTAESLEGEWKSTPNGDTSLVMEGRIQGETIEIYWNSSPDVRGLYWKGTFDTGGVVTEGETIVSEADTVALGASMFGSSASTKNFTYNNGNILFDFTVVGITRTVTMEKV